MEDAPEGVAGIADGEFVEAFGAGFELGRPGFFAFDDYFDGTLQHQRRDGGRVFYSLLDFLFKQRAGVGRSQVDGAELAQALLDGDGGDFGHPLLAILRRRAHRRR